MARSASTDKARRADWADFVQWCAARSDAALPASVDTVVEYLHDLATHRQSSTVARRLAAIGDAHHSAGIRSPTDDDAVRVATTRIQWAQRKVGGPKVPLEVRQLEQILAVLPPGGRGLRDRALLLVGYGAGLRPSELVALDVPDLTVVEDGLAVRLMRGRVVVPGGANADLDAARAWERWAIAAGISHGPAFRAVDRDGRVGIRRLSERSVTNIVQRAAARAGLDESRPSALALRLGIREARSR